MNSLMRMIGTIFILALILFAQAGSSERIPGLEDKSERYLKGNLHTHSLWSDGDDFPEMIADWYRTKGYDFLALTEHNVFAEGDRWIDVKAAKRDNTIALEKYRTRFGTAWVEEREAAGKKQQVRLKPMAEYRSFLEIPGKFLLIPGEELTHKYAKSPIHMNVINPREILLPIDGKNVTETIDVNLRQVAEQAKKKKQKLIAFLNHPNFGWGVTAEDMILASDLRFFEVYNGHPGVNDEGDANHPNTEKLWDIVNALRLGKHKLPVVKGMATDDAHGYHKYGPKEVNPGRGWVMVKAPYLSAEAIVQSMDRGDFYLSSGVELNSIEADDKSIRLNIKPEANVKYTTQFIVTARTASLDSTKRNVTEKNAQPVTQIYSDEIGKVVATSSEINPSYQFRGDELYVRAKVTSTAVHPNPPRKGELQMAWTQPIVPKSQASE
jgi:predicted metal-dependent phosphoesterase TrpH